MHAPRKLMLCISESAAILSHNPIYHFSMGAQRRRSVFSSHIAQAIPRYCPGNIMGKWLANDFDPQPVQRNDAL